MALGVLVSAVLLVYVCYSVDWDAFLGNLRNIRWLYVPLLLFLSALSLYIRGLRWQHLLPTGLALSPMRLTQATTVGFFATMVLPLRAGEFIRPWFLTRIENVTFSTALASIIVERVFDVLALVLLLALCLGQIEQAPPLVLAGAKALLGIALAISVLMILSYFHADAIAHLMRRTVEAVCGTKHPNLAGTVHRIASEFLSGLRAVSSFKELFLVICWSLVLWLEMAAFYQIAVWAFNHFPSWWVGITTNVMVALAVAAPSAPGFIGTFEAGCKVALSTIFGYPQEFALAYAILTHTLHLLLTCVLGAVVLSIHGLSLRDMRTRPDGQRSLPE